MTECKCYSCVEKRKQKHTLDDTPTAEDVWKPINDALRERDRLEAENKDWHKIAESFLDKKSDSHLGDKICIIGWERDRLSTEVELLNKLWKGYRKDYVESRTANERLRAGLEQADKILHGIRRVSFDSDYPFNELRRAIKVIQTALIEQR